MAQSSNQDSDRLNEEALNAGIAKSKEANDARRKALNEREKAIDRIAASRKSAEKTESE